MRSRAASRSPSRCRRRRTRRPGASSPVAVQLDRDAPCASRRQRRGRACRRRPCVRDRPRGVRVESGRVADRAAIARARRRGRRRRTSLPMNGIERALGREQSPLSRSSRRSSAVGSYGCRRVGLLGRAAASCAARVSCARAGVARPAGTADRAPRPPAAAAGRRAATRGAARGSAARRPARPASAAGCPIANCATLRCRTLRADIDDAGRQHVAAADEERVDRLLGLVLLFAASSAARAAGAPCS